LTAVSGVADAGGRDLVLFETPRLLVRRATVDDADALLAIFGDPENVRLYGTGQPWSRADAERFILSYPVGDDRLVASPGVALLKPCLEAVGFGGVGYYRAAGNTPDLLFAFRRAYRGRGLATELARAALAEAFTHPEIDHVLATVHPANTASVRVLEKCGMVLRGHVPDKNRLLYRLDRSEPA
jgi:RimJ/RimL family protein N-acetyltransferase